MYQVNDVVCYQNYGLCRIKEIKKISVMNQKPRPYYLMEKVYDQCDSTLIKIPVDTANFMRPVLTHDEAIANIREAIALCAEVRAEEGLPVSIETIHVDVAV